MFKYRSKCRWNLLLYIDKKIVEICPNQEFSSTHEIPSKYLEVIIDLIPEPQIIEKKVKKPKEPINDSITDS